MGFPFFNKKESSSRDLVPAEPKESKNEMVPVEEKPRENNSQIVVVNRGSSLAKRSGGAIVQTRRREVMIQGKKVLMDPQQLMRMIRQVTQTIGEYKRVDNVYSAYVIPSLRKARSDMVSDLEHHFGIHWEVSDDGDSNFWM